MRGGLFRDIGINDGQDPPQPNMLSVKANLTEKALDLFHPVGLSNLLEKVFLKKFNDRPVSGLVYNLPDITIPALIYVLTNERPVAKGGSCL